MMMGHMSKAICPPTVTTYIPDPLNHGRNLIYCTPANNKHTWNTLNTCTHYADTNEHGSRNRKFGQK